MRLVILVANLSYNLNYNIVENWDWNYSPILQPTTQPPNHPPNHPTTHPTAKVVITVISQLLLIQFWLKFKCRPQGTSRTDSNCYGDICPVNICPGDICPYQEYFRCYWPDFYETLKVSSWKHLEQIPSVTGTFVQASFVLTTIVHIKNISAVTDPILMKS